MQLQQRSSDRRDRANIYRHVVDHVDALHRDLWIDNDLFPILSCFNKRARAAHLFRNKRTDITFDPAGSKTNDHHCNQETRRRYAALDTPGETCHEQDSDACHIYHAEILDCQIAAEVLVRHHGTKDRRNVTPELEEI